MATLKSTLVTAIVIPILLALSLTACSVGPSTTAPGANGTVVTATDGGAATLAVKKYKMATVRKHHTRSNCWTVIGKNVYKLTSFVSKHPGGSKRIIALCGKNGTTSFRNMHGTGGRANTVLKKYKIGVLA